MPAQHLSILPGVHGRVKLLTPVDAIGNADVRLNDRDYTLNCGWQGYQWYGTDRNGQGTHYTVTADCERCSCPDFAFRGHIRSDNRCKHIKSCIVLINRGKLPRLV